MSLDYYLFCRWSYKKIIANLDAIIFTFEGVHACANSEASRVYTIKPDIFVAEKNVHWAMERKWVVEDQLALCEIHINELCQHDFVEDDIDIAYDKCQHIRYCRICEYTDPVCRG
jgi:hypothetical protein